MTLGLTPSQTVGPFFAIGLPWPDGPEVVAVDDPRGFWIRGRVLDGAGQPVPDALIESWQADPGGHYAHPEDPGGGSGTSGASGFRGFGRCPTDAQGRYALRTVKPGRVTAAGGRSSAPHLAISVFARGLLDRVVTRVYFADEAAANDADPVLAGIADPAERATLIAAVAPDGYTFDIRLQGPDETVFFAV